MAPPEIPECEGDGVDVRVTTATLVVGEDSIGSVVLNQLQHHDDQDQRGYVAVPPPGTLSPWNVSAWIKRKQQTGHTKVIWR